MITKYFQNVCSANAINNDCFTNNLLSEEIHKEILEGLKSYTHPPDAFKEAKRMIKDLLSLPDYWFHSSLPVLIEQHPCFSKFRVEFIGSTSEGLSLDEFSEIGFNIEFDVTTIIETIHASENPKVFKNESFVEIQHSDEFPGFATLRLHHPGTTDLWNGFCNIMSNENGSINEFFISPESVTDELYLMMCYRNAIENLSNFANSKRFTDFGVTLNEYSNAVKEFANKEVNNENNTIEERTLMFFVSKQEGPAIKTTTLTKSSLSFQFDCCYAIKCNEWPSIADEFKRRLGNSSWLSERQMRKITSVDCLLVPKSPSASKTNLEWRYSFCLAEREIMQCLTDYQKKCYVLVKAIWRKFLNPPYGKGVTSYHLKNVTMWECEDLTNADWTEELIVRRVHGIFQRLCKYLVDGYCPHFILPNCNLFIDIEPGVLFRSAQRVQTIIFQFKTVWTDNYALFYLEAQQTRQVVGEQLHEISFDVMVSLLEKMTLNIFSGEEVDLQLEDSDVIFPKQRSELHEIFGEKWANFALDYLRESGRKPDNVYGFMCARAPPKQLLKFAHEEGALYGISILISEIMALGEMLDFLVKMNVLKTENFEQYGFHSAFSAFEMLQLIYKYGSLDADEEELDGILTGGAPRESDVRMNSDLTDDEYEDNEEFVCDVCDSVIEGSRFHCTVCEDFDLCFTCNSSNDSHKHDFVEIEGKECPDECPTS